MSDLEELRAQYDEYVIARARMAEQLRRETEERIDEILADQIEEIRAHVKELYDDGASKTELREAVRAYGHANRWKKWWTHD